MIIDMVEKLKDAEDLKLEALFRSDPLPDNGFSARVVSRVRRRIWVRRLSLPVALVIGASIAAGPLLQFVQSLPNIVGVLPQKVLGEFDLPMGVLTDAPVVLLGIVLLGVTLTIGHMLED